jgi:N-acetyl-gamma-glutamylphosphate reductase
MEATKTALILGSTGQTGRHLLRELIACPTFTRVCEAGRRVTSAEDLSALQGREKLEQVVVDFERLDEAGLKDGQWDVVFIAYVCPFSFFLQACLSRVESMTGVLIVQSMAYCRMGTTLKAAGPQENFTKIDKEWV